MPKDGENQLHKRFPGTATTQRAVHETPVESRVRGSAYNVQPTRKDNSYYGGQRRSLAGTSINPFTSKIGKEIINAIARVKEADKVANPDMEYEIKPLFFSKEEYGDINVLCLIYTAPDLVEPMYMKWLFKEGSDVDELTVRDAYNRLTLDAKSSDKPVVLSNYFSARFVNDDGAKTSYRDVVHSEVKRYLATTGYDGSVVDCGERYNFAINNLADDSVSINYLINSSVSIFSTAALNIDELPKDNNIQASFSRIKPRNYQRTSPIDGGAAPYSDFYIICTRTVKPNRGFFGENNLVREVPLQLIGIKVGWNIATANDNPARPRNKFVNNFTISELITEDDTERTEAYLLSLAVIAHMRDQLVDYTIQYAIEENNKGRASIDALLKLIDVEPPQNPTVDSYYRTLRDNIGNPYFGIMTYDKTALRLIERMGSTRDDRYISEFLEQCSTMAGCSLDVEPDRVLHGQTLYPLGSYTVNGTVISTESVGLLFALTVSDNPVETYRNYYNCSAVNPRSFDIETFIAKLRYLDSLGGSFSGAIIDQETTEVVFTPEFCNALISALSTRKIRFTSLADTLFENGVGITPDNIDYDIRIGSLSDGRRPSRQRTRW